MKHERNTSLVKIKSNRENALKSTGPKSQKGKTIVKWNALKHGLLSKEIVIETGDGKESKAEFKALLTQLHQDLQPQGLVALPDPPHRRRRPGHRLPPQRPVAPSPPTLTQSRQSVPPPRREPV